MREATQTDLAALGEPEPEYLTASQVAALLQVSEKSVFRWAAKDAAMPCLRIGRTVRFPRARLLRWLSAREQGLGRAPRTRKPLQAGPQALDGQGKTARGNGAMGQSLSH